MINIYIKEKKSIKEEYKNKKDVFNPFYGKEDNYSEENIIINDLDKEYYNDVMDMNKIKDFKNNLNMTWILVKINNNDNEQNKEEINETKEINEIKKDNIEVKEEEKKEENVEDNKVG